MVNVQWLAQEARTLHDIFTGLFYSLITTFLLVGVFLEYFKWPLGGVPSFAVLFGRALVEAILLHTYSDFINILSDFSDGLAHRIGDLNQFKLVLARMGDKYGEMTASGVLVRETTYCFKLKKGLNYTKTHDKAVHLPMNELVIGTLRRRKGLETGLVFPQALLKDACKKLQRRCRRYGVKPIRFHDLRHTFASCLAMASVDLMVIKDLMRHKSYQMTLRYAHLHPDHLRGATDVLAQRGQVFAHAENCNFFTRPRSAHETEKSPSRLISACS